MFSTRQDAMKAFNRMYFGTVALSFLATALMAGCASLRERPPADLSPRSLEDVEQAHLLAAAEKRKPKLALVLGGGGLRGFAHLGVLRALEEAGVQPDIVVGTSAGAVVGAAYASGLSPDRIESIARGVKLASLIDFTLSTSGLMRGDNIASWIDGITAGVPVENFPRRFAAVATDLRSGRAMLLDRGTAGAAVQASAAVPGVTVPVAYRGGHLVDGGIASLVPVRFARALGADFVVAVDIYCTGPGSEGLAAPSVLMRAMRVQSCLAAAAEMSEAGVLISPPVSVSGMSAKGEQEQAIKDGYNATLAAMPRIQAQLRGQEVVATVLPSSTPQWHAALPVSQ
jgi:NTE family protein